MKSYDTALNYDFLNEEEKKSALPPKKLFKHYLEQALVSWKREGLGMDEQRRLFKISEKLEKSDLAVVEFEDAEFDLIKQAFENAKFIPAAAPVLVQIYDAIEKAKK